MSAPLEVLCVDKCAAYPNNDDIVFEFYLDPLNPFTPYRVTKMDLDMITAPTEHASQYRWKVYSMNGVADVCYEGCEDSMAKRTCHTVAVETMPNNANIVDDPMAVGQ